MGALRGSDRRHLRGLANPIKAVVQIGEAGLTEGVLAAVDRALRDHELIKVRIAAGRDAYAVVIRPDPGRPGVVLVDRLSRPAKTGPESLPEIGESKP